MLIWGTEIPPSPTNLDALMFLFFLLTSVCSWFVVDLLFKYFYEDTAIIYNNDICMFCLDIYADVVMVKISFDFTLCVSIYV